MGAYKGYKVHITKDGNETGTPSELSFNENGGYQAQGGAGPQAAGGGLGVRNKALNMGLVYMGKQAMNYGLSNYGNLTGDYIMQEQLSAGVELLTMGLALAKGGALGVLHRCGLGLPLHLAQQTQTEKFEYATIGRWK